MTERLHFHFSLSCIGEGNGSPLQCSCLENPRDWGACWAAVSGVAQSWTQLKWLSNSSSSKEKIGGGIVGERWNWYNKKFMISYVNVHPIKQCSVSYNLRVRWKFKSHLIPKGLLLNKEMPSISTWTSLVIGGHLSSLCWFFFFFPLIFGNWLKRQTIK